MMLYSKFKFIFITSKSFSKLNDLSCAWGELMDKIRDDISEFIPYLFIGDADYNFVLAFHNVNQKWFSVITWKIALRLATLNIFEIGFCMDSIN